MRLKVSSFVAMALVTAGVVTHTSLAQAETKALVSSSPSNEFEKVLLQFHNVERERKGAVPLGWNDTLEDQARDWAQKLAKERRMYHSTYEGRHQTGENLWAGTAGPFGPDAMMTAFLNEREYFKAGQFPNVSSTEKWQDVGHYTQIIWRSTTHVGCAIENGGGFDFLVCRYWPSGNVTGTWID